MYLYVFILCYAHILSRMSACMHGKVSTTQRYTTPKNVKNTYQIKVLIGCTFGCS